MTPVRSNAGGNRSQGFLIADIHGKIARARVAESARRKWLVHHHATNLFLSCYAANYLPARVDRHERPV